MVAHGCLIIISDHQCSVHPRLQYSVALLSGESAPPSPVVISASTNLLHITTQMSDSVGMFYFLSAFCVFVLVFGIRVPTEAEQAEHRGV